MDLSSLTIEALEEAGGWANELADLADAGDADALVLLNTGIDRQELIDFARGPVAGRVLEVAQGRSGDLPESVQSLVRPMIATSFHFAVITVLRAIQEK